MWGCPHSLHEEMKNTIVEKFPTIKVSQYGFFLVCFIFINISQNFSFSTKSSTILIQTIYFGFHFMFLS